MNAEELNKMYKCSLCGNIVEVVHVGGGELVCCKKPMDPLEEKTDAEGREKHVPIIEKTADCVTVKVGAVSHPMEEKHFIETIEIIADGVVYRKRLSPGQAPEAKFCIKAENIVAREYCTVHGLWKS